jgi:hypothetical protein
VRIAFSAACGIVCVLLALRVRSYWRAYHFETAYAALIVVADLGEIHVSLDLSAILAGEEDGGWGIYDTPPLFDSFENFPMPKPSPLQFGFQYNQFTVYSFQRPAGPLAYLPRS